MTIESFLVAVIGGLIIGTVGSAIIPPPYGWLVVLPAAFVWGLYSQKVADTIFKK